MLVVCTLLTDGIITTAMTTFNLLSSLANRMVLNYVISRYTKNVAKIGDCNVGYISFLGTYVSEIQLLAYIQKMLLNSI